jgi:hypothetical protein
MLRRVRLIYGSFTSDNPILLKMAEGWGVVLVLFGLAGVLYAVGLQFWGLWLERADGADGLFLIYSVPFILLCGLITVWMSLLLVGLAELKATAALWLVVASLLELIVVQNTLLPVFLSSGVMSEVFYASPLLFVACYFAVRKRSTSSTGAEKVAQDEVDGL